MALQAFGRRMALGTDVSLCEGRAGMPAGILEPWRMRHINPMALSALIGGMATLAVGYTQVDSWEIRDFEAWLAGILGKMAEGAFVGCLLAIVAKNAFVHFGKPGKGGYLSMSCIAVAIGALKPGP